MSSLITVLDPGFGFTYIGCYNELVTGKALAADALFNYQTPITVEVCAQYCNGYTFMGVEYGGECYCANTVANGSSPVTTESGDSCLDPQYACAGDTSEQCGGYGAYDLYAQLGATTSAQPPSATGFTYYIDSNIVGNATGPSGTYNYIGCYTDPGASTRALNGNFTYYGADTVDACANYCTGYSYFGLESGGECFCGNSIDNGAHLTACQNECYQCCGGGGNTRCGGYYRLSMYELNAPMFVEPSQTAVCTYNGPATAIVNTASSTYTYYGPITTASTESQYVVTNSMGQTTSFTSTEYYCEGGCMTNQHTPGASVSSSSVPTATATPTEEPSISGCGYVGCYDDNGGARTLPYFQMQLNAASMTQEVCVAACIAGGYPYAGVEEGSQCFCGDSITPQHALVAPGNVTSSGIALSCTNPEYACTGNVTEQCGGFGTIDIWYCPQIVPSSSLSSMMTPSSAPAGSTTPVPPSTPLGPSYSFSNSGDGRSGTLGTSSTTSMSQMGSMSSSSIMGSMSTSLGACSLKTAVLPFTR